MKKFKEIKKEAKKNLKGHYIIFVLVCIMASFIGAEFINSISISPTNIMDDQIQVAMDIDKYKSDLTDISQESNQKLQNSRGVLASIINSFASKSIYNGYFCYKIFGWLRKYLDNDIYIFKFCFFSYIKYTICKYIYHYKQKNILRRKNLQKNPSAKLFVSI